MEFRDVNEFAIATYSVDVFNGPRVLLTFTTFTGRVLIPTKEETESAHNKNFIIALTIDLHRPLLALEYQLLRLLERSSYNTRGSFELSLFTSM